MRHKDKANNETMCNNVKLIVKEMLQLDSVISTLSKVPGIH